MIFNIIIITIMINRFTMISRFSSSEPFGRFYVQRESEVKHLKKNDPAEMLKRFRFQNARKAMGNFDKFIDSPHYLEQS